MQLTADNVTKIVMDCLYQDHELVEAKEVDEDGLPKEAIISKGIVRSFGFHPGRLESHRDDIIDMLGQLNDKFKKGGGEGASFLEACVTKTGEQWGEHPNMEELFCLGQAIGKVKLCMPRDMWYMFPGGMPYYTVEP